jgi:TfoX/Sxy family transcriptional regulator of competence genes
MAYDEALAERVRDRVRAADGVSEKRMFGGLAFLVHGNLLVGVRHDDLLVRVAPEETDEALAEPGASRFDMTGRQLRGWVVVAGEVLDDDVLDAWLARADRFVARLPPK